MNNTEQPNDMLIYMTRGQFVQVVESALERQRVMFESALSKIVGADVTMKGEKEISNVLGICPATMRKYREQLIKYGAIWYEGRVLRGSRNRLLQFRDECMIGLI